MGQGKKDRRYKEARKARLPTLVARGYAPRPGKKTCLRCHNKNSPFFPGKFCLAAMKKAGLHPLRGKK